MADTVGIRVLFAAYAASLSMPLLATTPGNSTTQTMQTHCEGTASGAEALGCYLAAAGASDANVTSQYQQLLKAAQSFDRQSGVDAPKLTGLFIASQDNWRRYAKAQCKFEGQTSLGGSGTDILEAACQDRLNRQRLNELKTSLHLLTRR